MTSKTWQINPAISVIHHQRVAMDLWLSTSTLDTWVHGQSMIHGAPEVILSDLNIDYNFNGDMSPLVTLRDGEAKMEMDLAQRICQDMV